MKLCYQDERVSILECPPQCRTIIQREGMKIGEVTYPPWEMRHISLPWTVFYIRHYLQSSAPRTYTSSLSVAFRNSEMTQADQRLYFPHFYNIYAEDLRVCMPAVYSGAGPGDQIPESLLTNTITQFWQTGFSLNPGLHARYKDRNAYSNDMRVSTLKNWAINTEVDPNFATTVTWKLFGTLSDLHFIYINRE